MGCTYVGNSFKFTFKNYQIVLALLVFLMLIKSLGFEAIEMPQYNAYKHRHINILFSKRNGHVASGIFQRTINNSLFQLQMRRLFIILQQPLTVKNARIKRALLCYNPLSPYQKPYLLALDSGFQRALWAFSLSLSLSTPLVLPGTKRVRASAIRHLRQRNRASKSYPLAC